MQRDTALFLEDDEATAHFGATLAQQLRSGDLVSLEGDLGAGKTALARAIVRGLAGDPTLEVPSPTFALVQPYETPAGTVLHADLYRIGNPAEVDELGLFDGDVAIVLVEWAERDPEVMARSTLRVVLSIPADGVGRQVAVQRKGAA